MIGENDHKQILILLKKLVSGYCPSQNIVDWIFNENLKTNQK